MKLGVPVIARNNVAYAAIIKHESTGLLYNGSDVRMNSVPDRCVHYLYSNFTTKPQQVHNRPYSDDKYSPTFRVRRYTHLQCIKL